ncbi:MAG: nuclear transport factor 2 family protein [Sphingobacteriales bacterium]|nr:nuclear transport factor 2 family protein [Sphingobacteriales bacterium]
MKYFFILLTVLICGISTKAQTTEDSVKAVVNTLFTGMKNADAALLRTCFADSMVLQTIVRGKEGSVKVITENPAEFIDFASRQKAGAADERIRFETIKIDGPLALVWTPYEFYYNGQFSHCGVNSFHLVRFSNGWKIQFLIDTRRKVGCE